MKEKTTKRKGFVKLAAVFMAAVTMVSTMALSASAQTDSTVDTASVTGSNWMSKLPDNEKLNELSIPGAHDATAAKVRWGIGKFAQTQSQFTDEMLTSGVRYFDLRIFRDDDTLYMCHDIANCFDKDGDKLRLDTVIGNMTSFLEANPDETVILQVKCDRDENDANQKTYEFFRSMANEGKLYVGDHVPTLGEARGKIVVLSRLNLGKDTNISKYEMPSCTEHIDLWALDVHNFTEGDKQNKTMGLTAEGSNYQVWTEDAYNETRADKWQFVSNSLTGDKCAAVRRDEAKNNDADAFCIIYASMSCQNWGEFAKKCLIPFYGVFHTDDSIVWPKEGAEFINPGLLSLLKENTGLYTGCLVCDYVNAELASAIYMTNFNR